MDSTLDNSNENDKLSITHDPHEENIIIDELYELFKDNKLKLELSNLIFKYKNSLINILESIKQNYTYFSSNVRDNLENILTMLENIQLLSFNLQIRSLDNYAHSFYTCLTKLFELFVMLFYNQTNNSFLEYFLNFYMKFLKKMTRLGESVQIFVMKHFSHYFIKVYDLLIEKKIEFVDKIADSKLPVKITKLLVKIVKMLMKYNPHVYYAEIKPLGLFQFLMTTKVNLFSLSNDIFIEQISDMTTKVFKKIFMNDTDSSNSSMHDEDFFKMTEIILNKMLEISKFKDNLHNFSVEYSHQYFYVNSLILCLKLFKMIMKIQNEKLNELLFNDQNKEKLTRVLIELSFWDNYTIVDYTCKIFRLMWIKFTRLPNFELRSNIEKIVEYIYIRRYTSYIDRLDSEDSNIKLSVLEIITKHLNYMISNDDLLLLLFINFDFCKVRFNLVSELFKSIGKYYSLSGSKLDYLKKLFNLTFLLTFNEIDTNQNVRTSSTESNHFLENYSIVSELWLDLQKMINNGKFKKLYSKLMGLYGLKEFPKGVTMDDLSEDDRRKYENIARSIAILIRYSYYIDINIINATIAENHEMSKLILKQYLETFDFKGMDIIKAYELFVSTFKLTGEQYQIYNFIEKFSCKYFHDNKDIENFYFKSEEELTTLAYSIMMLNTDLHNPNLDVHMSLEQFIKNNLATKLYDNVPVEFFKNIYKCIASDPLKVASPRLNNYTKGEEMFLCLKSKHACSKKIKEESKWSDMNIVNVIMNNDTSLLNIESFPQINAFENCTLPKEFKCNSNINAVYPLLWEELFCNFITFPDGFYSIKDENTYKIIEKVCKISEKFNQKENIDKVIMCLNTIISSADSKKNFIPPYNLFFKISINFSKNFHSNLETYYQAILDIIKHKLNEEDNRLRKEYISLLNCLVNQTFPIVNARKHIKSNSTGLLNYIFSRNSDPNVETNQAFDLYRNNIVKHFNLTDDWINIRNKATCDEELIELERILDIIRAQEEEFIFFVTLASSKILDHVNKTEHYFSLIFLNEILDKDLSDKEFIKIWQNLSNIFKSKIEFKRVFDKEENLFDILYTNHFFYEIASRFFHLIELEDIYLLLEAYSEVDNVDILFIVMEKNDLLLNKMLNHPLRSDKLFENVVNLHLKLIENYIQKMTGNTMTTHPTETNSFRLSQSLKFLNNLLLSFKDFSSLMQDSLCAYDKVLKLLYENNSIQLYSPFKEENLIYELISTTIIKLIPALPSVNDEKWEMFIYMIQFCLKCSLNENEDLQSRYIDLILQMTKTKRIPLSRYKQIYTILNNFFVPFVNLKVKYDNFWIDMFKFFYNLFMMNEEIFHSEGDIELLWSLFVKKYLLSFVDYNKKTNKLSEACYKPGLEKIFQLSNSIVEGLNEKPIWWQSAKNSIRLYFPDLVKEK